MSTIKTETESIAPAEAMPEWLELVRRQVSAVRFGMVQIIIHDSQVTLVEKTERVRLGKTSPKTF